MIGIGAGSSDDEQWRVPSPADPLAAGDDDAPQPPSIPKMTRSGHGVSAGIHVTGVTWVDATHVMGADCPATRAFVTSSTLSAAMR